jgi:hypothetical protein
LKAFSFIRQAVHPFGKVGTSPFFHASYYSVLASRIKPYLDRAA